MSESVPAATAPVPAPAESQASIQASNQTDSPADNQANNQTNKQAIDTVFGFDFGLKRIGVAMGNTLLSQAQPLKVITGTANEPKFAAIAALIAEWRPARIVVGVPFHPDGAEHEMTQRCRRFANQLHGRFGLPVILVDERYSSAVIQAKRGEVIDAIAASIILQQYFDDHAQR